MKTLILYNGWQISLVLKAAGLKVPMAKGHPQRAKRGKRAGTAQLTGMKEK